MYSRSYSASPSFGQEDEETIKFVDKSCAGCIHCYKEPEMHCRRFPPQVYFNTVTEQSEVKYPGVTAAYSCGEHQKEGD